MSARSASSAARAARASRVAPVAAMSAMSMSGVSSMPLGFSRSSAALYARRNNVNSGIRLDNDSGH